MKMSKNNSGYLYFGIYNKKLKKQRYTLNIDLYTKCLKEKFLFILRLII